MRVLVVMIVSMFMGSAIAQAGGGAAGALIGAGVGAAIGHNSSGGAARGAAIGAAGGYVLGRSASHGHDGHHNASREVAVQHENGHNNKGNAKIKSRKAYANRCHEGQEFYEQAFRAKKHAKKVYLLEKAAWYCPQDARVHNDLGVSYYNRNHKLDRKRAEDQFRMAVYIQPKYKEAKQNLKQIKRNK